jgi:hypothetical protein
MKIKMTNTYSITTKNYTWKTINVNVEVPLEYNLRYIKIWKSISQSPSTHGKISNILCHIVKNEIYFGII